MRILLLAIVYFYALCVSAQSTSKYDLLYCSYLGGSEFEQARDMATDDEGNIYIVGGTSSPDFPTTSGAYNMIYNNGGSNTVGQWGPMMVFVSKFSKNGDLIWSTYLGGPNYDRAYAVEVDDDGYVYVGGRAGEDFPTTAGAFQEDFIIKTPINRLYGHQNGFISKLSPDGSNLIWSTYYGSDSFGFFRDIDVDDEGNVYGILNAVRNLPNGISVNAFDNTLNGNYDMVPVKFSPDGSQVIWAGVLGGSGEDRGGPSIRVAPDQTVYVAGATESSDFPTTPGSAQPDHGGQSDVFLTRISKDGSSIIFSTYLGGSEDEFSETHILALDDLGQAHIACASRSADVFTTPSAIQPNNAGNNTFDNLLAKYSTDGQLLSCSFLGGSGQDYPEGIWINDKGDFLVGGGSHSMDFPTSISPYQSTPNGADEGFIIQISGLLDTLKYSTYFGGSDDDAVRAFSGSSNGRIAFSGQTLSTDLPLSSSPFQATHNNPNSHDSFLAILEPERISTSLQWMTPAQLQVTPNPFMDKVEVKAEKMVGDMIISDTYGKVVFTKTIKEENETVLDLGFLNPGHYVLSFKGNINFSSISIIKL